MTNLFLKTSISVLATVLLSHSTSAQDLPDEIYYPPGWNENFVGKPAPNFTMITSSGSTLTSENLKGKFVVLDFWATWCKPCKILTHELDSALKKYGNNELQIIGVNHGEQQVEGGKPVEYWQKSKYAFPMSINDEYAKKLKARFPTAVVIDPGGIIVGYFNGLTPTTAGEIDATIWEIIKKPDANIATITKLNDQGEFIKAIYLHDKLINKSPEQKTSLLEQCLRAMLHTNPWMGLNIAKEWSKTAKEDKSVLKTIGRLIAESNVQEKDIIEFGERATEQSL